MWRLMHFKSSRQSRGNWTCIRHWPPCLVLWLCLKLAMRDLFHVPTFLFKSLALVLSSFWQMLAWSQTWTSSRQKMRLSICRIANLRARRNTRRLLMTRQQQQQRGKLNRNNATYLVHLPREYISLSLQYGLPFRKRKTRVVSTWNVCGDN